MRKITIELYANNEYALRERLLEVDRAISHTVWPSCPFTKKVRSLKESGCIEEEKNYLLSDYEYEKEDPTFNTGGEAVVAKWQMQIVKDEEYVNFQDSEEL